MTISRSGASEPSVPLIVIGFYMYISAYLRYKLMLSLECYKQFHLAIAGGGALLWSMREVVN